MKTNVILAGTEHILRQFDSRDEAEEWLANNANEDDVLTETGYPGQTAELVDVPTYRIETLDDETGQWEPEPDGECDTVEEGERLIADLRANLPERVDTEMRVVVDTAV